MSAATPTMDGTPAVPAAPVISIPSATGVDAHLVLAGPGARSFAFLIDWLIRSGLSMVYLLVAALLIFGNLDFEIDPDRETLWYLAGAMPATAIYFLYHLILEPLMSGRTPGKRLAGVRVLTPEGLVPTTGALLTRNVFRIIDSMPLLYVVGLLFVFFSKRHLRLGDLAAGTVIAMERAPFLEKLRSSRQEWHAVRQRAASLSRARQQRPRCTRRGRRLSTRRARSRQRAPGTHSRNRSVGGEYLEAVYSDLHDTIHRPARRLGLVLLSLMRDRVPAAMSAMSVHLLAVTLLFIVSAVTGAWLIYSYPDLIAMFASPQLIATVERGELWTDGLLNVTPSAVLSVSILTNNIVVSFFAFCSGIVFGLGTFYLIGTNGLSLGAIFAFTGQHGLADNLFDFVIAHGCVELSCICIAGAAGAYVGEALIRPGALTRSEAFRAAAGEGIRVLAVVTLLLFICGFIEGYVSPDPEVPRWARVTIGVGYWLFMISLLRGYVFGRSRSGPPIAV